MSIHFGFQNTKGLKVSEQLNARGINLLQCAPSDLEPIVWVNKCQPAFATYTKFLPAFMQAFNSQQRVDVSISGHPISYGVTHLVTADFPSLAVSFPNAVPAELLEVLRTKGYYEASVKGQRIMIFKEVDRDLITRLMGTNANRVVSAPAETVNLACIPVISLIRRIFSCFFRTHHYPAFTSPEHESSLELMELGGSSAGKRRIASGPTGQRKRSTRSMHAPGDDDEDMVDDDTEPAAVPASDTIRVALPPPPNTPGWGNENEIPTTYGAFCHYVPQLANPDKKTVVSVLIKYFLGSLGSTTNDIFRSIEQIKSCMGIIGHTGVGKELTHMAKCIDLGLQAQARIFPIVSEGMYMGCVLSGFGFHIRISGSEFTAQPYETINGLVNASGPHTSTLRAISNILCGNEIFQINQEEESVTSMAELRLACLESSVTEAERDEVVKLAGFLRFPQKKWMLNPNQLISALTLIRETEQGLPKDIPIHPTMLFERDVVSVIWSAFGDMAPTCNFVGGKRVRLDDAAATSGHIAWKQVPLTEAIASIQNLMRTREFLTTTANRRSGPFKDRVFQGNDARNIWSNLKLAVGVQTTGNQNVAGNVGVAVQQGSVFDMF